MIIRDDADLYVYPQVGEKITTHVCLGDLHGNTVKLLYFLIKEDILRLKEEDYLALVAIYKIDKRYLTSDDLNRFKHILNSANVNTLRSVLLLGDDLADRGHNDYFTLLVLNKLHQAKVHVEILLSNHGMAFLKYFYGGALDNLGMHAQFIESLVNLDFLINSGLVTRADLNSLVNKSYIPKLKAFSYSLSSTNELTLYSHAPVGLETVRHFIEMLNTLVIDEPFCDNALLTEGLIYNDSSIEQLMASIDTLNKTVFDFLLNETIIIMLQQQDALHNANLPIPIPLACPLLRLVWNRLVGDELEIKTSTDITINFVHGHVGRNPIKYNADVMTCHESLDTDLGKHHNLFKTKSSESQYCVRVSNDTGPKPQINAKPSSNNYSSAPNTIFKLNTRKSMGDLSSLDNGKKSPLIDTLSNTEDDEDDTPFSFSQTLL